MALPFFSAVNFYVVNVPSMAALKLPVLSELGREACNLSLAGTGQLQEATGISLRNYTLNPFGISLCTFDLLEVALQIRSLLIST